MAHNDAGKLLVVHEAVVQPHKLIVLPQAGELCLLEGLQSGLRGTGVVHGHHKLQTAPTLVCTVNLTFSCSLRASEMSTIREVSVSRSTVSDLGC